jgi:hypothetical protein
VLELEIKMKSILLSLFLCVTLAACSYSTKTVNYGQFYVEQDWVHSSSPFQMHSSSGVTEERICSRVVDFCLEGERVNISPNTLINRKMMVVSSNGPSYFLDIIKGTQLTCQSCDVQRFRDEGIVLTLNSLTFNERAEGTDKVFISYGDVNNIKNAIIVYHQKGATWIDVAASGTETWDRIWERSFNDTGTAVSWFDCDSECTLVQYDIESKKFTRSASPCTNYQNLTIVWEHNKAVAKHKNGADRPHRNVYDYGGVCRNDKGEPYFPILPYRK